MYKPDIREILRLLVEHNVHFIVVGGVAAVLQGASFSTFDLDVVHSRTPENIERLLACLRKLDARFRSRNESTPTAGLLASPGQQLLSTIFGPLDMLGSIEGGRDYDALLAYTKPLDIGLASEIRVMTLGMLLCLKEASLQPKDQSHAAILRRVIEEESRLSGKPPEV